MTKKPERPTLGRRHPAAVTRSAIAHFVISCLDIPDVMRGTLALTALMGDLQKAGQRHDDSPAASAVACPRG